MAAPIWPTLDFGPAASWRMLVHQVRLETVTVVRSAPFIVMLLLAVINVLMAADFEERLYSTRVLAGDPPDAGRTARARTSSCC